MGRAESGNGTAYLCVDAFIADAAGARALASAFELGLIDHLLAHQPCAESDLAGRARLDGRGLALLLGLLRANRVVERDATGVRLTEAFSAALHYRDLLEAKLDFAAVAAPDFLESFTTL